MRRFLAEFLHLSPDAVYTVIVMDEGYMEQPRRYHVRPFRVCALALGGLFAAALLAVVLVTFTPLRQFIPGYGTAEMKRHARQNAHQVAALEDSLGQQRRYLRHLQRLMTGPVDSAYVAKARQTQERAPLLGGERAAVATAPSSARSAEGAEQPFAQTRLDGRGTPAGEAAGPVHAADLDQLQMPVYPPVDGFVTRGFDTQTGHYAIDIAAEAGTPVRTIGDGYVVMADRTQEGGQAIAVQHTGGYLSLYKHNRQLLKRVGERVEAREVIARSGNSGEITSGPHLHVELWHDGLAQDPSAYFIE